MGLGVGHMFDLPLPLLLAVGSLRARLPRWWDSTAVRWSRNKQRGRPAESGFQKVLHKDPFCFVSPDEAHGLIQAVLP